MTKLIAFVLPLFLAAAQTEVKREEAVRRVVEFKYLTGNRAERAANLVRTFMGPGTTASVDPELRTAVLVGPPEIVTAAEALVRKFDIPGDQLNAQVTLGIHLIEASSDESRAGSIPKVIEPAIDQMKKAFSYKAYRLLDTVLLVGKGTGGASANGLLPLQPTVADRASYEASYYSVQVFEDGKTVGLRDFRFQMVVPQPNNRIVTSIKSDLTIRAGQKLVIGKLSTDQPGNAIFLVLTAEIQ